MGNVSASLRACKDEEEEEEDRRRREVEPMGVMVLLATVPPTAVQQ
jgi:hypothetical protein